MSIISKIKGRFLSKINSSLFKTKWFNDTLQFAGCKAISGLIIIWKQAWLVLI